MKKQFLGVIPALCMVLSFFSMGASAAVGDAVFSNPAVTELTVTYRADGADRTVSLLRGQEGAALPEGGRPVFTVHFDSVRRLGRVYITSTKEDGVKYLEAFPGGGNTYVTSGSFDADDTGYLPGTIGVAYTKQAVAATGSDTAAPDISMAAVRAELEEQGVWIEGDLEEEDGSFHGTIVFDGQLTGIEDMRIGVWISKLCNVDELDEYEVGDWMGSYFDFRDDTDCSSFTLTGADGGTYVLYMDEKDWENESSFLILIHDTAENSYTRLLLTRVDYEPAELAEYLSQTDFVCTSLLNYCGIFAGTDELPGAVEADPLLTGAQKTQALRKINGMRRDQGIMMLGTACLPLLADSAVWLEDTPIAEGSALLFSSLLGGLTAYSDYFWQYRLGMEQGCAPIEGAFSWDAGSDDGSGDCTHTYIPAVTAPTCTERGYTTYTCDSCGETYVDDYTDMLGHSWGGWVTTKYPSALADGQRERVCPVCGQRELGVIPASGGSSGGGAYSGGAGSANTDSSEGAEPARENTGGPSSGVTVITPRAAADGNTAVAALSAAEAGAALSRVRSGGSSAVMILPGFSEDANRAEVSVPGSFLEQLNERTDADLVIHTPAAQVSIPNDSLRDWGGGGTVTVTTEREGAVVRFSITAGDQAEGAGRGNVTLAIPVDSPTPGTTAVLLHRDGTRQVIRKSVVQGDYLIVPLNGSAALELVDNAKRFSDVTEESWAFGAAAYVSGHELFHGTGADTFAPNAPMTRGMLAVVLHNLENNPKADTAGTFRDTDASGWNGGAIAWASAEGIVSGYGNNLFGPDDNITREQLAVMLWNYAGAPMSAGTDMAFRDLEAAGGYALEALRWAVESGIISGYEDNRLGPKEQATRAETAQMLKNYAEKTAPQGNG